MPLLAYFWMIVDCVRAFVGRWTAFLMAREIHGVKFK